MYQLLLAAAHAVMQAAGSGQLLGIVAKGGHGSGDAANFVIALVVELDTGVALGKRLQCGDGLLQWLEAVAQIPGQPQQPRNNQCQRDACSHADQKTAGVDLFGLVLERDQRAHIMARQVMHLVAGDGVDGLANIGFKVLLLARCNLGFNGPPQLWVCCGNQGAAQVQQGRLHCTALAQAQQCVVDLPARDHRDGLPFNRQQTG